MKEPAVFDLMGAVGPDAPTEIAENGAKQSASPFAATLFPPYALLGVAEVLKDGAEKYGAWNWLGISAEEHLNHAIVHTYLHLLHDESEGLIGHLLRVATRANMALHVEIARIIAERKGETNLKQTIDDALKEFDLAKGYIVKTCPNCQSQARYYNGTKEFLCLNCKTFVK